MSEKEIKKSVQNFAKDLEKAFEARKYVVFLCGPTLKDAASNPAAALRLRLKNELEADGFEVVLGEDDGLEYLRAQYTGMAHDNELKFIKTQSNAVLLIAESVGSFCELGLFSHEHVRDNVNKTDFILILDEKYKDDLSYLNEGPAQAIENFGKVYHTEFSSFDTSGLMKRLKIWRNVWFTSDLGRPRSQ